ncbi:Transcription initiation factor TFIID subunit 12 [Physocladia obscura]|uniref:Transcription initiation factor TFIID subunit 12 n=1 Tax=Physocladia obscura TaxID=109957 RepID=A0AAD5TB49_9FUNG|nr:Transcription initiation factor TFIID subunit 12 [Physocladia obscura]
MESSALVSLEQLRKMAALVDPREKLDADVELMLADVAADFLHEAAEKAVKAARHRGSDTVQPEDVMLPIDIKWKLRVAGFNQDIQPIATKGSNLQNVLNTVKAAVTAETRKSQQKGKKGDGTTTPGVRGRKPKNP